MKLTRRNTMSLVAAAGTLLVAGPVAAQAWPAKPITIVVSYPAGGDTDAVARIYAGKLTQLPITALDISTALHAQQGLTT